MDGRPEQLGVRCLAQGHLRVNWHLSSYQSTLHTLVCVGLELATVWFPSQVLRDYATATPQMLKHSPLSLDCEEGQCDQGQGWLCSVLLHLQAGKLILWKDAHVIHPVQSRRV